MERFGLKIAQVSKSKSAVGAEVGPALAAREAYCLVLAMESEEKLAVAVVMVHPECSLASTLDFAAACRYRHILEERENEGQARLHDPLMAVRTYAQCWLVPLDRLP